MFQGMCGITATKQWKVPDDNTLSSILNENALINKNHSHYSGVKKSETHHPVPILRAIPTTSTTDINTPPTAHVGQKQNPCKHTSASTVQMLNRANTSQLQRKNLRQSGAFSAPCPQLEQSSEDTPSPAIAGKKNLKTSRSFTRTTCRSKKTMEPPLLQK